jgi:hypothetical protein
MNKSFFIASAGLLCIVLVLAAGCTQPATPQATPTPTTVVTTAPPTPTPTSVSLTPDPTQTLPEMWNIEVQVQSNNFAPDPQIIVIVRGGKGLNFIQQIDIRVTRSDGGVEEDKMVKPMFVGKELSFKGTTQNKDRCEVWAVTPQGERVKIYDAYVPFRQY